VLRGKSAPDITLGTTNTHRSMWNYAFFAPAALLLALLAVSLTRANAEPPLRRAGLLALGLWLLSWLVAMLFLYGRSGANFASSFVPQRDLGYWSGSALLMSAPFLAVLAAGKLLPRTGLAKPFQRIAVLLVAGAAWLLTPWLFFVGWVTGCVTSGYPSCM
jgi:hypothetical protein